MDQTTNGRERYFYHSFPRRGRSTDSEIEKGCRILSLICDAGLVLAPEVVKWSCPHADGAAPREQQIIQRRICFTELASSDLIEHANEFGHFALEFDVKTLKRLGAMPVFYIPQATEEDAQGVTSLGSTLVVQSIDAMILAMRLAGVKKILDDPTFQGRLDCTFGFEKPRTFALGASETRKTLEAFAYALTPYDMLEHALTGLLSCFYPADNLRDNKALAYYRQREWRIGWNFAVRGEEIMHRPSDELIDRLLEIDAAFFGRDFPTPSGMRRLANEAYVLPGIGDKRIIDLVNRVVVPRAALEPARRILARVAPTVPIVCIENRSELIER
jgi:Putative abortive phage resistance protein AbiGi, antitoxin